MIKAYNLHPTLRENLGSAFEVPRRKFHVCKADANNADYLYDCVDSGRLFHTILEAVAVAQDYDDIIVWPGTWSEGETIPITQNYLRLLAAISPYGGGKTDISGYGTFSGTVISIDGHGVEVAGFRIMPYNDLTSYAMKIATTKRTDGAWIHHNNFYPPPSGVNGCGIMVGYNADLTHSTYIAIDVHIEDNIFYKGRTKVALEYAARCHILRNKFYSIGSGADGTLPFVDIRYNHTQNEPGGFDGVQIQGNTFKDMENGAHYGIQTDYNLGGTDLATGDMAIFDNSFLGFDLAASCITDADADITGRNWWAQGVVTVA